MANTRPDAERIAELEGRAHAIDACIKALLITMPSSQCEAFSTALDKLAEIGKTFLVPSAAADEVLDSYDEVITSMRAVADAK